MKGRRARKWRVKRLGSIIVKARGIGGVSSASGFTLTVLDLALARVRAGLGASARLGALVCHDGPWVGGVRPIGLTSKASIVAGSEHEATAPSRASGYLAFWPALRLAARATRPRSSIPSA